MEHLKSARERENAVRAEVLKESRRLQAKYAEYVNPLKESFNRRKKTLDECSLGAVLNCLEQHAKDMRIVEATSSSNVGTFIQYGYDLIVAIYPNLVLNNIASIQPLNNRNGEIWFYNLVYDVNKGLTAAGNPGISSLTGVRPDRYYASEFIQVSPTGTVDGNNATFTATVTVPVRTNAGNDGIVVTDGNEVFQLDPTNTFLVGSLGGTGTFNSGSGAISVTFNTAPVIGATILVIAKTTFETNPSAIGKTRLQLTSSPISAEKHALISDYTLDAEYDIARNFNMNISEELVKGTAALIRAEIDQLGMYEIKLASSRPDISASSSNIWDGSIPTGIAQIDQFRTLLTVWKNQSNQIYNATRMVHGNFVIVGNNIATVVEVLPEFKANPGIGTELQNSGPYVAGTIGGMMVIKNPDFNPNEWVVGNKGIGTFNTGYILAPYRGLMVTPPISSPSTPFNVTRGMYLEAGRQVVNGKFYSYGVAKNLTF